MRKKLIEKLAYELRYAENEYMDSQYEDASKKEAVYDKVAKLNFTEEEHVYLKWIMLKQIENIKKAINEENKKETKKDNTKILFMQKGLSDSRDIFEKIVMSKIGGL